MSFIKALFLAICATLFLTFALGSVVTEFLDIQVMMDNAIVEPLKVLSVSALVAVVLVLAAIAIVVSVFGSLVFVVMLVVGAGFLVLLGVFWPILMVGIAIWLLVRDKPSPQY